MTSKQIINSCEFQSRCIQYKDMYSNKHIKCPIVDFAIACRGENKCKYKTVYEQLKAKEQECKELRFKEKLSQVKDTTEPLNSELPEDKVIREIFLMVNDCINQKVNHYKQALDEIEKQVKAINNECFYDASCDCNNCDMKNNCPYYRKVKTLDIINSVKDKNVPHKAKNGEQ